MSCCGPVSTQNSLVQLYRNVNASNESTRAREFVARQWAFPVSDPSPAATGSLVNVESLDAFLREAQLSTLTISGMAFQDAWNLDLERLRDCFIHVVSPDRRLVPLCAYNLTDLRGRSLYRSKDTAREANEGVYA